jgi:hypothetical protein
VEDKKTTTAGTQDIINIFENSNAGNNNSGTSSSDKAQVFFE